MQDVRLPSDADEPGKGRGHSFERRVALTQRMDPMIDHLKAALGSRFRRPSLGGLNTSINKSANRELGRNAATLGTADTVGDRGNDYARGTADPESSDIVLVLGSGALL